MMNFNLGFPTPPKNEIEGQPLQTGHGHRTRTTWSTRSTSGTTMPWKRPSRSVTGSAAASRLSPWATTRPKRCCAGRWPWVPTTACSAVTTPSKVPTAAALPPVLKAEMEKGKYDLILTGAQADDGAGQVGGMLAAMLDWPYASLVNKIDTVDGDHQGGPRNRRRQPGDERDAAALRAFHPDRHQRTALRGHPRHPQGGLGGDPHPWRR
jgi:hypothetical protein